MIVLEGMDVMWCVLLHTLEAAEGLQRTGSYAPYASESFSFESNAMKREKHANLAVWQFSRYSSATARAEKGKGVLTTGEATNALMIPFTMRHPMLHAYGAMINDHATSVKAETEFN